MAWSRVAAVRMERHGWMEETGRARRTLGLSGQKKRKKIKLKGRAVS